MKIIAAFLDVSRWSFSGSRIEKLVKFGTVHLCKLMAKDKLITSNWLVRKLVARMPVTTKRRRKTQPERTEVMREWRKHNACPAVESIMKVGNELRLVTISCLISRPLRFNELLETAKGVDPRSLSRVLKF